MAQITEGVNKCNIFIIMCSILLQLPAVLRSVLALIGPGG